MKGFTKLFKFLRSSDQTGPVTSPKERGIRRDQIGKLRIEASKCAELARNLAQSDHELTND